MLAIGIQAELSNNWKSPIIAILICCNPTVWLVHKYLDNGVLIRIHPSCYGVLTLMMLILMILRGGLPHYPWVELNL